MARNYRLPTIKTLFAEASSCAYPGCKQPLIFHDRGKATVNAEIAHIRSESPRGPRYEAEYTGDLNGPDNLMLLCGIHHRPVDQHDSIYTIAELEQWKLAQRASAGAGIHLTESDAKTYARLTEDENNILIVIARLTQRLVSACQAMQPAIDTVRTAEEGARLAVAARVPLQVQSIGPPIQLSYAEVMEWDAKVAAVRHEYSGRINDALDNLAAEIAALNLISPSLRSASAQLREAGADLVRGAADGADLTSTIGRLEDSKETLWQMANGAQAGITSASPLG